MGLRVRKLGSSDFSGYCGTAKDVYTHVDTLITLFKKIIITLELVFFFCFVFLR